MKKKLQFLGTILLVGLVLGGSVLGQTEYYVAGNGDNTTGTGSSKLPWRTIDYAISQVSNPTTDEIIINLSSGIFTENSIEINRGFTNLTIKGMGISSTTVRAAVDSGTAEKRIFYMNYGENVSIKNMSIINGDSEYGSAIYATFGSQIILYNCRIANNNSDSRAVVTMSSSNLEATNCTFEYNESANLYAAGALNVEDGNLVLTNCTFNNNNGINTGALYLSSTDATITNCTFAHNYGPDAGAIALNSSANASITNCSIAYNSSDGESPYEKAGGIQLYDGCTLTIKNTILSGNKMANDYSNDIAKSSSATVTLNDNGYNIVYKTINLTFNATGDIVNSGSAVWPLYLSTTLEENNTSTETYTLKFTDPSSIAINAGNDSNNGSIPVPSQDQRGANRNGTVDIGAYEYYDVSGSTPVELTTFTASVIGESVVLNWNTATEINNYGFEVEKSVVSNQISEKNWEVIGFVDGHGNSNSPNNYSFVASTSSATKLSFRLKQIDFDGGFEYSDVVTVDVNGNMEYKLAQNHPNPFNPTTQIAFTIPSAGIVKLNVYNILGEVVAELVNQNLEAGSHQYQFDASNLTSGIYFYSISVNGFSQVKKMNLIK